jgi:hypothetical protein
MMQTPLNYPLGAQVSAAITTNATTMVASGTRGVFSGLLVNTAGSAWVVQVYDGDPAGSGVLLVTLSGDTAGAVLSPLLRCPSGVYIVTSGTTAGSLNVAYYG